MKRRNLIWHLYPSYLAVTLVALLGLAWYALGVITGHYQQQVRERLEVEASLVAPQVKDALLGAERDIDPLVAAVSERSQSRITLLAPNGLVISDSHEDPPSMDNHADRPEFQQALRDGTGVAQRFSHTLQKNMLYVARSIEDAEGGTLAVLRVAVPLSRIAATEKSLQTALMWGLVVAALAAGAVSYLVSRRITEPLKDLRRGATRYASGDLAHRLATPESRELADLSNAMNEMAAQLNTRIETIIRQRNEQEAVLASMAEGVLALDMDGHVISLNPAASELLGLEPALAAGRSLQELVRNTELVEFLRRSLLAEEPLSSEIVLYSEEGRQNLQLHGTSLRNANNEEIGALVVFSDVTRLRQLEEVRRDFVANVSHELMTPITSIKGFVETLQDGALEDPPTARRFLAVIERQVNSINAIVKDLLTLSQLEQNAEGNRLEMDVEPLKPLLEESVHSVQHAARDRDVEIHMDCETSIRLQMHPNLVQHAVVNLLDNAIKYSDSGTEIRVAACIDRKMAIVTVRDQGWGIPQDNLNRIFERFYRVDKARSRAMGGTGLGLAIVKHIIQAHHGSVSVQSTVGQGSEFALFIPLQQPQAPNPDEDESA